MFREVPVLPVVVPIAGVVIAILVWHLRRRDLLTVPRAAVALAVGVYAAGVVAHTVFPIFLDKPASDAPWGSSLNATPLVGYEVGDAVMNIGVFVPVGVLVALMLPRVSWWRTLAVAGAFSLAIETTQYLTAHLLGGGHVADVNDLLFDVVGAALGLGLLVAVSRVSAAARVTARFAWARGPRTGEHQPFVQGRGLGEVGDLAVRRCRAHGVALVPPPDRRPPGRRRCRPGRQGAWWRVE